MPGSVYRYDCTRCGATRERAYPEGAAPRVLLDRCEHHDEYAVEFRRTDPHPEARRG